MFNSSFNSKELSWSLKQLFLSFFNIVFFFPFQKINSSHSIYVIQIFVIFQCLTVEECRAAGGEETMKNVFYDPHLSCEGVQPTNNSSSSPEASSVQNQATKEGFFFQVCIIILFNILLKTSKESLPEPALFLNHCYMFMGLCWLCGGYFIIAICFSYLWR